MPDPEHDPVRYSPPLQARLEHGVQTPLAVAEAPKRNDTEGLHAGCALHVKPSVVPAHTPALYCCCPTQRMLEHVLHWKPSVAPEQLPTRYWLAGQSLLAHPVHSPAAVAVAPLRKETEGLHDGCGAHLKPLVTPEHDPVRYWLVAHLVLEHVLHL